MTIRFHKLINRRTRHRPGGRSTVDKAHLRAEVDRWLVTCTEGIGWLCTCPDPACGHLDAVAALIHPDMLAVLESEPDKEKTA